MSDPVLEVIVKLAETGPEIDIPVTLAVGGLLISGRVISREDYMQENWLTASIEEGIKQALSQIGEDDYKAFIYYSTLGRFKWLIPAFIIVPLFALANAGVAVQLGDLATTFSHPVVIGILLGLVIGKPLGITLFSWLALRSGLARLPDGVNMGHIFGAGLIAGIGFTMSIFIDQLSFEHLPHVLDLAKTAILSASVLAAVLGAAWFIVTSPSQPAH